MGFFSKSSAKQNGELVAVFDIGSASVGGALFFMQKSGVPKIIFSVREIIPPQHKIDAASMLLQTKKTLDNVAKRIVTSSFGAPKKIFCVLSSLWYISQNRLIQMKKNTPFVFNDKLANSLIEKEIKLFKEGYLEKHIKDNGHIRVIEFKNIKTMLNGYEVINPYNQKAKELEMTLFISMGEENILSGVEEIIARHFHTHKVIFSSFLMASFTVMRDMHLHQDDFILVDIGGEITDISMIKKSALRESVSYPIGSNLIIRNMVSMFGFSFHEAKSYLSLYKDGHAEEKVQKRLEPIIGNFKTKWLAQFQSSLANLSNDISIPAAIFFTCESKFANFFNEIIKTEQFSQYTLTQSKFQVNFINTAMLHKIISFGNNAIRDTSLTIDAIYINRFLN